MKNLFISFLVLIVISSCENKKKNTTNVGIQEVKPNTSIVTNSKITFNPGQFVAQINCSGNENFSFAVYTPISYNVDMKMPAFFLFDPHADGSFPLKIYRGLADKFGYILIASNNSKNGTSPEVTGQILNNIYKSALELLPIDNHRIYAAGFSGGARVASMMAFSSAGIQGLVTCGAGFPQDVWTSSPPSCIVGIAGDGDMNLSELTSIKIKKKNLSNRFQLIRFNGKHEWPPSIIFEQAILALQANAIRDSLTPNTEKLLSQINDTYKLNIDSLSKNGNAIYTVGLYERWIMSLEGIANVSSPKKSLSDLLRRPDYKFEKIEEGRLLAEEQKRRELYLDAFEKKDASWWEEQIANMNKELLSTKIGRVNMINRLTGLLSLSCFMNLNHSISSNNSGSMDYFSNLYRIIDPTNTEAWYLSAVVASKKSDLPQVYNYFSRSVSLGFNDFSRAQSDPSFKSLNNDPEFNQIVSRISH